MRIYRTKTYIICRKKIKKRMQNNLPIVKYETQPASMEKKIREASGSFLKV